MSEGSASAVRHGGGPVTERREGTGNAVPERREGTGNAVPGRSEGTGNAVVTSPTEEGS